MPDLLLEIGTEELPPGDIAPGMAQLGEGIRTTLTELRLGAGEVTVFGTPRRLILFVPGVAARQRPAERRIRGPAAAAAYDAQGHPTQAATGFARSQGVPVDALEIVEESGGRRYVAAVRRDPGKPAPAVLPAALAGLITGLAFSKTMRWGAVEARFARPIRWLVGLFGSRVLAIEVAGVRAGRTTQGHRALASGSRAIRRASSYLATVREASVIVDPAERRALITGQAMRLAAEVEGHPVLDAGLLEETVMSVEHPHALRGGFDDAFLSLPRDVLVTVMQHHQKYFAVEDGRGTVLPAFIAVRDGGGRHIATVRQGHEWVLAARLADAQFFFGEDRKRPLDAYVPLLDGLVFHAQLGTMGDKTRRLVALGRELAHLLSLDGRTMESLLRAAALCKADLVTHLVGEFPDLQGTIGQIYATMDGESTEVARAIGEHYRAPKTHLGALLGLIDRCDTLVGAVGVGLMPTGSQDPYGLRRAAAGIVEIVLMLRLRLSARPLLTAAFDGVKDQLGDNVVKPAGPEPVVLATDLLLQRLRGVLIERGVRYDVVDAALAVSGDDLLGGAARAEAMGAEVGTRDFTMLYVACDRATRILSSEAAPDVNPSLFEVPIERTLYDTVGAVRGPVQQAADGTDFAAALDRLRPLAVPVNQIFDDVLIMAPDARVRANRLALLRSVVETFRIVGDLSRMVMSEEEKKAAMGARE